MGKESIYNYPGKSPEVRDASREAPRGESVSGEKHTLSRPATEYEEDFGIAEEAIVVVKLSAGEDVVTHQRRKQRENTKSKELVEAKGGKC